ncbi:MAG: radical SAM protein [Kiritimatiellia bacterium]|nr:radical SAM protein [Kiritimatiellia bacterium]
MWKGVDMTDREPLSIRISLTDRCQLRCRYCPPATASSRDDQCLSASDWVIRLTALSRVTPISKIRFTGGEPLLYPELLDLVAGCSRLGIPDVALTTNGIQLEALAAPLQDAGLHRVNISLDSVRPETYRKITGAGLAPTLRGVAAAKRAGLGIKLNAVLLRGLNADEAPDLLAFAIREGHEIRFLEKMPIGDVSGKDPLFVPAAEVLASLVRAGIALEALPRTPGETSALYRVRLPGGGAGLCGVIQPVSAPFCDGCRRLRLNSAGEWLGCLGRPERVGRASAFAAAMSGDLAPLRQALEEALALKDRPHAFSSQRTLRVIGG